MKTFTKLICMAVISWLNAGTAMGQCNAKFSHYADTTAQRTEIFANASTGAGLSYYWSFGDGTSSDLQNPHHVYANYGHYNVCLYSYSKTDTTCKSTICDSVVINNIVPPPPAPCQAYFYANNDSVKNNFVHVQNHSQGQALIYSWNFGDGLPIASGFDPSHQYANKGTYNICLGITSQTDTSCHSKYCVSITTKDSVIAPPAPCQAYFYANNDSVKNNFVHVQNHSQGQALIYSWNFGDGSPIANGFDPSHQYAHKGTYNICLGVTSQTDTSCHSKYCVSITTKDSVIAPPPVPCHAYYSSHRDSANIKLIHFHSNSTGNNLLYAWNYNDGTGVSHDMNPNHTFATKGTYNVCLNVTSATDTSCHSMYCDTVSIYDNPPPVPCQAYFYASNDSVNFNSVNLSNHSTGSNLQYVWNFGDGKSSHDANPHHQYAVKGAYVICLSITSSTDTSCKSTYCDSIKVKDATAACKANFYTYVDGSTLRRLHTKNLSTGSNLSYSWDFGDGSSSTNFDPTHEYAQNGTYSVCLTISNGSGCSNVKCSSITVGSCKAGFYLYKDSLNPHVYYAVNTSWGHNIHYTWSFGDGTVSHDAYPQHTYQNFGKYYACVSVNDSAGCSDQFCDSIVVTAKTNGQISFNVVPPQVVASISTQVAFSNIGLYPNPVADIANLNITSVNNDDVRINIVNILGQISQSKTYKLLKGDNNIQLNVADLSQGIYYLTIQSGNNTQQVSLKFVK